MEDKTYYGEKDRLIVPTELLDSSGVSAEQFRHCLVQLKSILGTKFNLLVPKQINSLPELQWVIGISQRLQRLQHCDGFDRHIRTYTPKQLKASEFVTIIASHLVDKVDKITLEPPIIGKTKKSDIFVDFHGERVFLECKFTETIKFDYTQEHEHIFSVLQQYINVPHQIDITYKKSLSDAELHQLGKTLKQRVSVVTGDGIVIDNQDLKVQVIKRDHYADKKLALMIIGMTKDLHDNCIYPLHVYGRDGITLAVGGPEVDYTGILRDKFKKSKRQSPLGLPYILVIDGNYMLGDLTKNIRALSTAFQPKTNTRFSAAVIATHFPHLESSNLDLNFYFVSNPFAKFPISKEFEHLFQTK